MPLVSKHYEVLQAIHASITADLEIVAEVPTWKLQKRPWNRSFKYESGAVVCPLRYVVKPQENRVRLYEFNCLVAAFFPSNQDLTIQMATRMAVFERIDSMFAFQPKALLPAPMRALLAKYAGTGNQYSLESTAAVPGDQFVEGAFQQGLDALATVITVGVTGPKQDYSLLGS